MEGGTDVSSSSIVSDELVGKNINLIIYSLSSYNFFRSPNKMSVIYAIILFCILLLIFDTILVQYLPYWEDVFGSLLTKNAITIARRAILTEHAAHKAAMHQSAAAQQAAAAAVAAAAAQLAAEQLAARQAAAAQLAAHQAATAAASAAAAQQLADQQTAAQAAAAQQAAAQAAAQQAATEAAAAEALAAQLLADQLAADQAATEAAAAAAATILLANEQAKAEVAALTSAQQAAIEAAQAEQNAQALALAEQLAAEQAALAAQDLRSENIAGEQFTRHQGLACYGHNELGINYVPDLETCARDCINKGCSSFDFEERPTASNVCYLSTSCTPELASYKNSSWSLYMKSQ